MKYIKQFFFFSCLGYLFESIISLIAQNNFNSGILVGPYTPIYGFGVLLIIHGGNFIFRHLHLARWKEIIITFGIFFFVITLLELLGGILIEKIFNKVFWSYKGFKYSYGNYISLEISLIWSFLGIVIYYIKDFILTCVNRIPNIIYYILIIVFLIDVLYTFIKLYTI